MTDCTPARPFMTDGQECPSYEPRTRPDVEPTDDREPREPNDMATKRSPRPAASSPDSNSVNSIEAFTRLGSVRRFRVVPIGDSQVCLRSLTGAEYLELVTGWMYPDGKLHPGRKNLQNARLIQVCVVDDRNEPLWIKDLDDGPGFRDDDAELIHNMDSSVTNSLAVAVLNHLGLTGRSSGK